jgi:hypothetical protein
MGPIAYSTAWKASLWKQGKILEDHERNECIKIGLKIATVAGVFIMPAESADKRGFFVDSSRANQD